MRNNYTMCFRLSSEEFEFLLKFVDYYNYDSTSAVLRSLIRRAMRDEFDELDTSRAKL